LVFFLYFQVLTLKFFYFGIFRSNKNIFKAFFTLSVIVLVIFMLSRVPRHIGVILDGNRRFARRLMLKPWKGHEWGAKKIEHLLSWCREYSIPEVTFYAFSLENFSRSKEEFDRLMDIFISELSRLLKDPVLEKEDIRVQFIGRLSLFPLPLQEVMHNLMVRTAAHKTYFVTFAMAYSGRAEIIDATKRLAESVRAGTLSVEGINEDVFTRNTYLPSEPDLIIRTSGEQRTSGFLLWQGAYAELYFCPKMWPEFEKEDFLLALESYSQRKRRFGR